MFDTRPKVRRVDLFDFEGGEFGRLSGFVGDSLTRLIVVRGGLRRTGKTSLILTTLNELGVPYVFVDVREVIRSRRGGLYEVLSRALSEFLRRYSPYRALLSSFIRVLSGVRGGVRVHGFEVSLNWGGRDRPLLTELFREFDEASASAGVRLVIVIDEAQRLGGSLGFEVWSAVAHAYDFLGNTKFIISGSEMGVLNSIFSNPESPPLFGRLMRGCYREVDPRGVPGVS